MKPMPWDLVVCDQHSASCVALVTSRTSREHARDSESERERRIQASVLLMSAGPMLGEVGAFVWHF